MHMHISLDSSLLQVMIGAVGPAHDSVEHMFIYIYVCIYIYIHI